jgi:RNA polymerase sigma-70 factor (ECF subfamily)
VNTVFASIDIASAGLCLNGAGAPAPPSPERTYVNDLALDEDLERMRRIGSGDQRAYREMVDRYLASITRFSQRVLGNASEAEEVAQETFLRLWTQAASFTPRAKAKTWLYRIARNQCIDRLRKRHEANGELDNVRSDDRPSQLLVRKETAQQVDRALQALPERQRAAITLVHYEGLDGAEACEILEVSTEALESLLARARRSLREQLKHLATAARDSGDRP